MESSKYKPNGTFWSYQEDEQLNRLYNEKLMDVIEISDIMNRSPGSIISRLFKHRFISTRTSARGYNTYKNSDLYKSIVAAGECKKSTKTSENISINISGINTCEYMELKKDVNEIKNEIKEIKSNLNELIEMMKCVYEFEDT